MEDENKDSADAALGLVHGPNMKRRSLYRLPDVRYPLLCSSGAANAVRAVKFLGKAIEEPSCISSNITIDPIDAVTAADFRFSGDFGT